MTRKKNKSPEETEDQARQRMSIILQVRSGHITATEAAKILGISRKSYYAIENKALEAMLGALMPGKIGRPAKEVDPEKERLAQELREANKRAALAETKMAIKDILYETEPPAHFSPASEKKQVKKKN